MLVVVFFLICRVCGAFLVSRLLCVGSCSLLVVRCLFVEFCVVGMLVFEIRYLLCVVCCSLLVLSCSLFVAGVVIYVVVPCLLLVGMCWLPRVVNCWLFVCCCVLFNVC